MVKSSKEIKSLKHGGNIWGFSREYNIPVSEVTDFSGTINPLGAPPRAIEAIRESSRLVEAYPDPNPIGLKEEIAQFIGEVERENIIVGNGSTEFIYLYPELFAEEGDILIPVPAFTEYEKATLKTGSKPVRISMGDNFSLNLEKIENGITGDTTMIFICNPHSPSGTLYSRDDILDIVNFCHSEDIFVFIDENYIDFVDLGKKYSLTSFVCKYDNLFVTRSLSKFFGLPGLRIGFGIAGESIVHSMEEFRSPWNINALAIAGAKAALRDIEFIDKTKQLISRERTRLYELLKGLEGLEVISSATNFFLIKIVGDQVTSGYLRDTLGSRHGILIRDCSDFVGLDDSYFRITIKTPEENTRIVEVLREILAEA